MMIGAGYHHESDGLPQQKVYTVQRNLSETQTLKGNKEAESTKEPEK